MLTTLSQLEEKYERLRRFLIMTSSMSMSAHQICSKDHILWLFCSNLSYLTVCNSTSKETTKSYRGYLQDLVIAAGGTVLQRKPVSRDHQKLLDDNSRIFHSLLNIIYIQANI
jgi:hypothetical protein